MLKRYAALVVLAILPACGGGSSPSSVAPPPTTQPPPPNYSGAYSGSMLMNLAQQNEIIVVGRTTVTHAGNAISFSTLSVTYAGSTILYGLGSAMITGDSFAGTHAYQSSGCGVMNVTTSGRFAGDLMNLTATLRPAGRCDRSEFRGELRR